MQEENNCRWDHAHDPGRSAWLVCLGRNDCGEIMTGTQRLVVQHVDPSAYTAVLPLEEYVRSGILAKSLLSLIKIRASQLNGSISSLPGGMHSGCTPSGNAPRSH